MIHLSSDMLHLDTFGRVLVSTGNRYLPIVSFSGGSLGLDEAAGKMCILVRKMSEPIALVVDTVKGTELALRLERSSSEVMLARTEELVTLFVPE